MNMHVPQSVAAETELAQLAAVTRLIVSPRLNAPIIQMVQDTLTGAYRISNPKVKIGEMAAMNMISRIRRPLSAFKKTGESHSGPDIISNAFPLMTFDEKIKLENGKLVKGLLNKGAFNTPSEGVLHVIFNDFGPERCGQFINEIQSIVTKFNLHTGFSTGASDLISNRETVSYVENALADGRRRVKEILTDVHAGRFVNISGRTDGAELENQIMNTLREISAKITSKVSDTLPPSNRLLQMIKSGAKGDNLNITQMVALLGQQNVDGKRIQYTLPDRTLPHFERFDDSAEARGFVESSFVNGLRPAEYFFHAMGGREGLIDTAVKTSDTGYIQRRMMKTMEDFHVEYDGTVRNNAGIVIQYNYGEDGIDSTAVESQNIGLSTMSLEDIYRTFGLSVEELTPLLTEAITEAPDMVEEIIADRKMIVEDVFRFTRREGVLAPVHLKRMIDRFKNPYSTKTDLTPAYIVQELTKLVKEPHIVPNKLFAALVRFYLAPRKCIIDHRFTKDIFDEVVKEVRFRYMKSIVHAGEMVGALAAQSIGEPTTQLTLNSIDHVERVWVKHGEDIRVVRIGDFVQEWIAKSDRIETHPNNTLLAYMPEGWQTMSVDEDGKIEWRTLEAVTQHPPMNEDGSNTLVKITTKGGRTVLATKAKSFLTKGIDGKLVPTRGDEILVGTQVPLMADFPSSNTIQSIHVYDYIERGYKDRMPDTIELTHDFGLFVGAYISEGMANDHVVSISNNDETFRTRSLAWITSIDMNYRTVVQENKVQNGWTSTDSFIHCSQLARFMAETCGRGSKNKRVPAFAFSAPNNFICGLLSAYISGDGTVDTRRSINYTSISEQLIDGIAALLARIGVHARKSKEMMHKNSPFKASNFWSARIPVNECIVLRKTVRLIVPSKQARLDSMLPTQIVCKRSNFERQQNIVWDSVVSVEEQPCSTPFVYDFTVEGTRNFVHANGLCLRDTFHSAGTVKAGATQGVPRIQELLAVSRTPKNPLNFVYLDPTVSGSMDQAIMMKRQIQKTMLRDITKHVRMYYDPNPLDASTVVAEDREILTSFAAFSTGKPECTSPWILRLEFDDTEMAARDIEDMVLIETAIMNSGLRILQCVHSDANAQKIVMRIVFEPGTVSNMLTLRFMEERVLDVVISGASGVGRVYPRKVEKELIWDESVQGYACKTQYVLDVEGANMYELMGFQNVDKTRIFSNDIHEVMDVFGVEAARQALYDEFMEVFAEAYVNYHHLSVLLDAITYQGRLVSADRFGMKKQDNGVLAKSSFEETSQTLFNAAIAAEFDDMTGVSANIMFGQKAPAGTGFVDIMLDETRLPEGLTEEESDVLERANNAVTKAMPPTEGECRMDDILMEW